MERMEGIFIRAQIKSAAGRGGHCDHCRVAKVGWEHIKMDQNYIDNHF